MFGISGEHLLILGIVLLIFGPRRLPELGNTLGKAIRNFKESMAGIEEAKFRRIDEKMAEPATASASAANVSANAANVSANAANVSANAANVSANAAGASAHAGTASAHVVNASINSESTDKKIHS